MWILTFQCQLGPIAVKYQLKMMYVWLGVMMRVIMESRVFCHKSAPNERKIGSEGQGQLHRLQDWWWSVHKRESSPLSSHKSYQPLPSRRTDTRTFQFTLFSVLMWKNLLYPNAMKSLLSGTIMLFSSVLNLSLCIKAAVYRSCFVVMNFSVDSSELENSWYCRSISL